MSTIGIINKEDARARNQRFARAAHEAAQRATEAAERLQAATEAVVAARDESSRAAVEAEHADALWAAASWEYEEGDGAPLRFLLKSAVLKSADDRADALQILADFQDRSDLGLLGRYAKEEREADEEARQ